MEDESVVTNVRSPPTGIWQPIPNVPQMPWMPQQMIRPTLVPPIINAPQQQPNMQQWWPGPMQNDPRNYEPPFNLPVSNFLASKRFSIVISFILVQHV